MNAAALITAAIVGGLSVFFVIAVVISDILVPWIDALWHYRNTRPQATYRRK